MFRKSLWLWIKYFASLNSVQIKGETNSDGYRIGFFKEVKCSRPGRTDPSRSGLVEVPLRSLSPHWRDSAAAKGASCFFNPSRARPSLRSWFQSSASLTRSPCTQSCSRAQQREGWLTSFPRQRGHTWVFSGTWQLGGRHTQMSLDPPFLLPSTSWRLQPSPLESVCRSAWPSEAEMGTGIPEELGT